MLKCGFKVSGLNAERKVNAMLKQNVAIINVYRQDKFIYFEVATKNAHIVQEYLKQNNCEYSFEYVGLALMMEKLKYRLGLLCGVALFVIMLICSSNVVMQARIMGNSQITEAQIMQALGQNGVYMWDFKTNYDVEQIGNIIADSFAEISFSSAIIRGNTLVINVKENALDVKESFEPLKAQSSGVITSLDIKRGTCLVKVGDVVQAGQIIVEPYEVLHGEYIKVSPKAEVYATARIKGEVKYNSRGFLRGRVGEEYIERKMCFLGLEIPCKTQGDVGILSGEYEVEVEEQELNTILPIKQIITHYFKIGDTERADYARDKELLERQSQYLALEQIDNQNDIQNISTQTIEVDGVYYITTYIELSKNILSA